MRLCPLSAFLGCQPLDLRCCHQADSIRVTTCPRAARVRWPIQIEIMHAARLLVSRFCVQSRSLSIESPAQEDAIHSDRRSRVLGPCPFDGLEECARCQRSAIADLQCFDDVLLHGVTCERMAARSIPCCLRESDQQLASSSDSHCSTSQLRAFASHSAFSSLRSQTIGAVSSAMSLLISSSLISRRFAA